MQMNERLELQYDAYASYCIRSLQMNARSFAICTMSENEILN